LGNSPPHSLSLQWPAGIIDYIRQYTLDKQVEYVVKSSRVMGGKGKQPTVVPTQGVPGQPGGDYTRTILVRAEEVW
jgi:hypothetical protein